MTAPLSVGDVPRLAVLLTEIALAMHSEFGDAALLRRLAVALPGLVADRQELRDLKNWLPEEMLPPRQREMAPDPSAPVFAPKDPNAPLGFLGGITY